MEEKIQSAEKNGPSFSYTLRDFASVQFRHRGVIIFTFLGILLGAAVFAMLQPPQYLSQLRILLKRGRVDPVVTADQSPVPKELLLGVTEFEVNSEVSLLKSRDLLEKVVSATGLDRVPATVSWWNRLFSPKSEHAPGASGQAAGESKATSAAADQLLARLGVEPQFRSNVITVTYIAPNSQQAARVLNTFADLYLEKHMASYRPPGALEFFQQETERYRKGLASIEAQLAEFGQTEGVTYMQVEKEITLQKLNEFEGKFRDTRAAVAETEQRIRSLEGQLASIPPRLTSTVRTYENSEIVKNLKSALLTLELKRTELLGKYDPSYRLVQEVDAQISQMRASLAAEEKISHRDESTDRNLVYDRLNEELAKAKSELPGLQARAEKTSQDLIVYQERAHRLYQTDIELNDLLRTQKLADDSYQLYFRKQEDARITDALDKQRIINVAVIERAVPALQPSGISRTMIVLIAAVLAGLLSMGLAYALDLLDSSFRTPDEVRAFLNVPVLAAVPMDKR